MFENAGAVMSNPTSARDAAQMGAYNKQVRTDNAAGWAVNLNAETQKYDLKLDTEAKKALEDATYIPPNFDSREAFQDFYNRAKEERDFNNYYSPSTIQEGFGTMDANTYRNNTGYAPYILGRGKRLAENESVPVDITSEDGTSISGYKPVVRTLREDGSGNVQLYNADTTWGGKPVSEIAKEGGSDAVAASTLDAMPYSVENQDFGSYISGVMQRANMRRDTAYMDTVEGGTPGLDLDAPSREANEERLLNIAVDQGIISEEEAQARLKKAREDFNLQESQKNQTASTDSDTTTPGDFASLEDFNTSERAWISVWANKTRGFDKGSVESTYYGSVEADARRKEAISKAAEQYTNNPKAAAAIGITKELGEEAVKLNKGFAASEAESITEPTVVPQQHLKFGDEPEGKVYSFTELNKRLPVHIGALGKPSPGNYKIEKLLKDKFPQFAGDWVQDFTEQPYPFGISKVQFESGSIKDGRNAMRAAKATSEFNVKTALYDKTDQLRGHWSRLDLTDPEIVNRLEYLEGDAWEPGVKGLTEIERAEIDVVKKFYGEQTSNKQLEKIFLENPKAFKEYYADPYNFALKYADDMQALVPPTITPQDKINAGVNPKEVNKIDTSVVLKATENPVVTQDDIFAIEKEVEKLGTLREDAQANLVKFTADKEKRLQDLQDIERAFYVTNWMAATDKNDPIYRVLANTFPAFIATGDYSTWEKEMQLEWAKLEQENEKIAQGWEKIFNTGQSNTTSLLRLEFDVGKEKQRRLDTINDLSEYGKSQREFRESTTFHELIMAGDISDINSDMAAPYLQNLSSQGRQIAENIKAGNFGPKQKADYDDMQADVSFALRPILQKLSNDNQTLFRTIMGWFGADFSVGAGGFEIDRKIMAVDASGRMTDDYNEVAHFHLLNDASLAPEGNKISASQMGDAIGGELGIKMLFSIIAPTHELRRQRNLK